MLGYEAALKFIDAVACPPPDHEIIKLEQAAGRILVQHLPAVFDMPPFDRATMDGIAVGPDDPSGEFVAVGTVAAGSAGGQPVRRGECVRIMTGAMLPPGTGRVIRREVLAWSGDRVRIVGNEPDRNVMSRGAAHRAGETVIGPRRLAPADIGIIASLGYSDIAVARPPKIAILSTGDELVLPGRSCGPGQIFGSNGHHLAALLAAEGFPCRPARLVRDERAALCRAIVSAARGNGLVLLTGGVSVGEFDLVPETLAALGARIHFHGVAVKPGKPLLFAELDGTFVFGLPGNPVAVHVGGEFFVKRLLYRLCGCPWRPRDCDLPLAREFVRRDADRTEFVPVRLTGGAVEPVSYLGSGHLRALADAVGLAKINAGAAHLPAGTPVTVRLS